MSDNEKSVNDMSAAAAAFLNSLEPIETVLVLVTKQQRKQLVIQYLMMVVSGLILLAFLGALYFVYQVSLDTTAVHRAQMDQIEKLDKIHATTEKTQEGTEKALKEARTQPKLELAMNDQAEAVVVIRPPEETPKSHLLKKTGSDLNNSLKGGSAEVPNTPSTIEIPLHVQRATANPISDDHTKEQKADLHSKETRLPPHH